jgi:hypothetical protein
VVSTKWSARSTQPCPESSDRLQRAGTSEGNTRSRLSTFSRPQILGDDQGIGGHLTYKVNRWPAGRLHGQLLPHGPPQVGDAQRGGIHSRDLLDRKRGLPCGGLAFARNWALDSPVVATCTIVISHPSPTTRWTDLALDLGGVLEYCPGRRAMLQFELGQTAVFCGSARFVAPPGPPFVPLWRFRARLR